MSFIPDPPIREALLSPSGISRVWDRWFRAVFLSLAELSTYQIRLNSIITITADHTATIDNQTIWADASAGNVTVTLPLASSVEGFEWVIEKIDSTANEVIISSTDLINGDPSFSLIAQYESARPQSTGTEYFI